VSLSPPVPPGAEARPACPVPGLPAACSGLVTHEPRLARLGCARSGVRGPLPPPDGAGAPHLAPAGAERARKAMYPGPYQPVVGDHRFTAASMVSLRAWPACAESSWFLPLPLRGACGTSPDPPLPVRGACGTSPVYRCAWATSPEQAAGSPVRGRAGRAPAPGGTGGYRLTAAAMAGWRLELACAELARPALTGTVAHGSHRLTPHQQRELTRATHAGGSAARIFSA